MKRILLFSLCFILVTLASVIAHTPMSFVIKYMPTNSGFNIDSPTGTIWSGSAQNIHWRGDDFGDIRWQFTPINLMQGKANYHVRFGRGSQLRAMGKGNVGYGFSGLYADNIVVSVPAETVLKRFSLPVPVTVAGTIELSITDYLYAQPWCDSAEGTLVWSGGKLTTPLGLLDLGTVITDLNCEESKLTIEGEHNNNQISGGLDTLLEQNMRYKVNAWFKPGADFPTAMKSQLKWLGNPNNKGEYSFTYAGKLN